jgi:type IV fimbrial biogenesis protein FimT
MTLLELLIAVAIAGALLMLGVPGFGSFIGEQQLQDRADSLIHSLDRARSEAVKRGARVNVCPEATGTCPGLAAPWEGGWSTFVTASDGVAIEIAREPRAADGITIRGNRPVADYVSYTTLGHARRLDGALQMGTFTLCRHGHKARKVVLSSSGRARIDRTTEACP